MVYLITIQNIRIYNILGYTGYTTHMHMYNIHNRRYFVCTPGRVRMLGIDFKIYLVATNS